MILLLGMMALSCESENPTNAAVMDTGVEIAIYDTSGTDLLNPNNPNAFQAEEIKLFYKIDGERVEVFNPMMDYPRNFFIFQHENEYRIRIFLNINRNASRPVTYIQWNETDTDTLKAEFRYPNSSVISEKVWFNGEPVITDYFEIVK